MMNENEKKTEEGSRTPIEEGSAEDIAEHLGNLHRQGIGKLTPEAEENLKNSSKKVQEAYVKGKAGG